MKNSNNPEEKDSHVPHVNRGADIANPRNAILPWLVFCLKLLLGIALVYWLIVTDRFELNAYHGLISQEALTFIAGALITQSLSISIILGRWWVLLTAQNIDLSLKNCLKTGYQGTFMSLILPGTIGLDGLRLLYLQQNFKGQLAPGIASLTLDRALGFLGLLIVAVVCGFLFLLNHQFEFSFQMVIVLGSALIFTLFTLSVACGFIPLIGKKHLIKVRWIGLFINALAEYRTKKFELVIVVLLSIVSHLLVIFTACFGLLALQIEFSFLEVASVTPILGFIRFIPLTPLGLGVTDAAGEELYNLVGLAGGAENQMLLRVTGLIFLLICGLAFFMRSNNSAAGKKSDITNQST